MDLNELLNIHEETCEKCKTMMIRKNKDYTGGDTATDIFANFNSAKIIGMHPVKGLLIRVIDKVQRINSFANDKKLSVSDETVYDACEDIINYAILAKAMLMKERKEKKDYRKEENVLPD
jgi:hypothetical protein